MTLDTILSPPNDVGKKGDLDLCLSMINRAWIVVTDGGNGFTADWADWAEPRLVAADKSEKKLTDLKWKSATSDWGKVNLNQNAEGKPLKSSYGSCLPRNFIPRIRENLSAIWACSGRYSEKLRPGIFVWIVTNSPRNSTGASGFGSYMSMWLGPPGR